jgi:methionyl-tRNA formyltransferase
MRLVMLCATRRGLRVLEKALALLPSAKLTVFSFPEEPWEPPFQEEIRTRTLAQGGEFFSARQVGKDELQPFWERAEADLMLVVSWRYLIPPAIYRRPRLGTFVLHDSLLPEYRGFAPTLWAIANGEDHTGATLFKVSNTIDSGDLVDQRRVPIGPDDPIAAVMERVTQAYLELLESNLPQLLSGAAALRPQDASRATFTCKWVPEDSRLDWAAPTRAVYDLIRASGPPYPGAFTHLTGKRLRVWAAQRLPDTPRYVGRVPGRVVQVRPGEGSVVLTGDGALLLTRVQLDDGEPVCAAEVLGSLAQTLGR